MSEHERLLFAVAYRMLGTVAEAEDAVQEAFLRWTRADTDAVADPRAWLVTVTTRLCVDRLRSAQRRRETYVGTWLPEPLLIERSAAQRVHVPDEADPADAAALADSLSLAFLVVLETLSPAERAVFLLHDVFGYPHDEIARIVDRTPAACRQLASRARRRLAERRPRYQTDPRVRGAVADAFLAACAGGDLAAVVRLLDPDVVLASDGGGLVPAVRRPVVGGQQVARFLLTLFARGLEGGYEARRVEVNGAPGLLVTLAGRPESVFALDVVDDRVSAIHIVRNPEKLGAVSSARPR